MCCYSKHGFIDFAFVQWDSLGWSCTTTPGLKELKLLGLIKVLPWGEVKPLFAGVHVKASHSSISPLTSFLHSKQI